MPAQAVASAGTMKLLWLSLSGPLGAVESMLCGQISAVKGCRIGIPISPLNGRLNPSLPGHKAGVAAVPG